MENDKRYDTGMETMKKMFPDETLEGMKTLSEISPELWDMVVSFGFGEIYSRETISFPKREIVTLTTLITQGAFDQLEVHLRAALKVGLTKKEIMEIIIQLTGYIGFPKAIHAMQIAGEVFED